MDFLKTSGGFKRVLRLPQIARNCFQGFSKKSVKTQWNMHFQPVLKQPSPGFDDLGLGPGDAIHCSNTGALLGSRPPHPLHDLHVEDRRQEEPEDRNTDHA